MSLSQEIESRVNILDLVNRYIQTKKAGVNYKGLCPFHQEKTPSFIISPTKNICHCFSCGKGGGPIRFLMEMEKIDFREAVGLLAKEAGIELKTDFHKEKHEKGEDVYGLYRDAALWYHASLFRKENEKYLQYLLDRSISLDIIQRFQLGCSTQPRDMYFFLKEKGYTPQFLIDSGLFLSESRDKFFGRITFPIANSMGHVVAFTARVLDTALPKYLNSPASKIFDKSAILYGFHLAKQSIAQTGEVFIVEGQMDTIALHQAGVTNAVGISGTALTKEHIRTLKRFAKTIYLSLDSDAAGIKATFSSIENLLNEDIEVRIISIPNGKDPDGYIKSGGKYTDLRDQSLSPIQFYLSQGSILYDTGGTIGTKKLIEKCIEFLLPIKSQIEIDIHIQEISLRLGVSREAIFAEYKKSLVAQRYKKPHLPLEERFEDITSTSMRTSIPPFDALAGYISRYGLFDLFFREFRYTLDDLSSERDFSLLYRVITRSSEYDLEEDERLKVITLSLEQTHPDENQAAIEQATKDLIKKTHIALLVRERRSLLDGIMLSDPEYMKRNLVMIQKARSFGLSPSIFQ